MIVIAGPTAVGKTELTVSLAKRFGCEIISADSRQFFTELNIGTAKPTKEEMGDICHHFVDFISIEEEFSSGKFEMAVLDVLPEIFEQNDKVIMTGGSGLYIQAVCDGMNDIPTVNSSFRTKLYEELGEHGLEPLVHELSVKDPVDFKHVDSNNPQRVIRALEICRGTGLPYSSFRSDKKVKRDFKVIKIALERERVELFERIDHRMDLMIEQGLFEEAERYLDYKNLNALKTVGYKEVFDYLDGKYDKTEAIRLLKRNSRRYAKRQMTWFKKDPDFTWFHPDQLQQILIFIDKSISMYC